MKRIALLATVLLIALGTTEAFGLGKVKIRVELMACEEQKPLKLFLFNGVYFDELQSVEGDTSGIFTFVLKKPRKGFYHVGFDDKKVQPLYVDKESEVFMRAKCSNVRMATFKSETTNEVYQRVMWAANGWQYELGQINNRMYKALRSGGDTAVVNKQFDDLDARKKHIVDSIKTHHAVFLPVINLFSYKSYKNEGGDYASEAEYFANEFFSNVDFTDPFYNHAPHLYVQMRFYTKSLTQIRFRPEAMRPLLTRWINQIPENSVARAMALCGAMSSLQAKHHELYAYFAEQYLDEFGDQDERARVIIEKRLASVTALMPGKPAPDFALLSPEGDTVRLTDFKGKYVLLDFWASWCRPCRKENPNVVKAYNKYKDRGFEIIGISLDKDAKRWQAAIEKDKLTWYHGSDLKGWRSDVAALYKVSSIPSTYLIGPEGEIITKGLRAYQLHQTLKELLPNP